MNLPPVDRAALIAMRRDLHQHPELGFEETRTAALVAERLRGLGYAVRTGVGTTGVVGVSGGDGRCVLLRADMDALPVDEANDVPYRSRTPGRMHACGHDGHVAIGLEVARRLARLSLAGRVKLAFQPAEEINAGAESMVADGVLAAPPVDAAFGLHLWNDLPRGTIAVTPGPCMAAVDRFDVTIHGRGGHAAEPHQAVDPVVAAAHVITALQSLVARRRDPLEAGVVSVTQVRAGHAYNVIPDHAELRGTVRSFTGAFHDAAPDLVRGTVAAAAQAVGATADVAYQRLSQPVVNEARMAALMREVAAEVVGPANVRDDVRTMGGEDMSVFLAAVPGCFALVGSARPGAVAPPHHSPRFDIDEDALAIGAELLARTAVRYLDGPR